MNNEYTVSYKLSNGGVKILDTVFNKDHEFNQDKFYICLETSDPDITRKIGTIDKDVLNVHTGEFKVDYFKESDYNKYREFFPVLEMVLLPDSRKRYDIVLVDMDSKSEESKKSLYEGIMARISSELGEKLNAANRIY